ncbi:MAG TPA: alpha-xylosidase, partial [Opitutus sp.]|nr:alpha-xylosidase [Opitutus sp.]
MKFTDGQWLLRPGVTASYATEAHTLTAEPGRLVVHAPVRPIRHRGDTLQGPLLTVTLSSPLEGVVRVRIEHFTGGLERGPVIPLEASEQATVAIAEESESATLASGGLTVRVKKPGWELSFEAGGRVLTRSGGRGIGYIQADGGKNFVHEQLALAVGE